MRCKPSLPWLLSAARNLVDTDSLDLHEPQEAHSGDEFFAFLSWCILLKLCTIMKVL